MANERFSVTGLVGVVAPHVREYGYNAGMHDTTRAWLLHDQDVWVANPHYKGPPVRHPEDDCYEEDEA